MSAYLLRGRARGAIIRIEGPGEGAATQGRRPLLISRSRPSAAPMALRETSTRPIRVLNNPYTRPSLNPNGRVRERETPTPSKGQRRETREGAGAPLPRRRVRGLITRAKWAR